LRGAEERGSPEAGMPAHGGARLDLFSLEFLSALGAIVVIDLVLAGPTVIEKSGVVGSTVIVRVGGLGSELPLESITVSETL
jgi:hypothetical protein